MSQATRPILLDTDIGSDIDDAVALAYLLSQPRCDLLGITTVSGDSQARAALADVICQLAGRRDIPILAGRGPVLVEGPGQDSVPQAEVLGRYPHRERFPETALEFLSRTIRSRPGEITLLTIGPLTNIGALFAYDPSLPPLLKRLVLMAGPAQGGALHIPAYPQGDAVQPSAERFPIRDRGRPSREDDEHRVHGLVGRVPVPQIPLADAGNQSAMPCDDAPESRFIALRGPRDQIIGIVHGCDRSPRRRPDE